MWQKIPPEAVEFGYPPDFEWCPHACERPGGSTEPVCIICDYPDDAEIMSIVCETCTPHGGTWHLDGRCLRCGAVTESRVNFLDPASRKAVDV